MIEIGQEGIQPYIGKFMNMGWIQLIKNNGLKIVFILISMYLSIKIGKYLIKNFVEKQVKSNAIFSLDSQRAKTLGEVLKSLLKYLVYFVGITAIVSIL